MGRLSVTSRRSSAMSPLTSSRRCPPPLPPPPSKSPMSFPTARAPPSPPVLLTYAEGDHRPCSLHHQDQDHRSPREEVLRLDRRIHPGFPLHLPADVDLQAGVRRVRPRHRPPQVLLNYLVMLYFCYVWEHDRIELSPVPRYSVTIIFLYSKYT